MGKLSLAEQVRLIEDFLSENFAFRHNEVGDTFEYKVLRPEMGEAPANTDYEPVTDEALNSIILEAMKAGIEGKVADLIKRIICSKSTEKYNPFVAYLNGLPKWDGVDRVADLIHRIPGIDDEKEEFTRRWFRSMVAHWYGLDRIFGNQLVLLFIGNQGCGKSTFCRLLLPEHLREYFLDHVNLANKFDKEMALTNNLIVNVDELDQVRRSQQAELKQLLSKSRVNGRPIYGRAQDDRRRYASFVATTNNLHPLHDPTGSRRFLCIEIPYGKLIDNQSPIDYEQLYAQLLCEFRGGERYWLTEDETRSLQRANAPYQSTLDMERMVDTCFRHPADDEPCRPLEMSDIVDIVARQYPFVRPTQSTKVQLGIALSARGYEHTRDNQARHYYVVPIV